MNRAIAIEIQIFLEIAMSIGNHLDMEEMLRESLQTYLRKLDLSGGIVFRVSRDELGTPRASNVFSIPKRIQQNKTYQKAFSRIARFMVMDDEDAVDFQNQLPVIQNHDSASYAIADLPGFGLLVLIGPGNRLTPNLMTSLKPMNSKLANACVACLQNAQIKAEIKKREISEKKAIESGYRLNKMFNTVQAGIVLVDAATLCIQEANESAVSILGAGSKSELLGQPCYNFLCSAGNEEKKRCQKDLPDNEMTNVEETVKTIEGHRVQVMKTRRRMTIEGHPHFLIYFIDITPQKEAENQSRKLQAQLDQARKLETIGSLASGIAHDFNNILQAISGYAEILSMDKSPNTQDYSDLAQISQSARRGADLVRKLLMFSRESSFSPGPLNMNYEAKQANKLLARIIPRMISIEQDLDPGLWQIHADPVQIEQILLNLGTNAAHAMPEGGRLSIRTRNKSLPKTLIQNQVEIGPGDYVTLCVSDTGQGMDNDILEKIFDPFFTTKPEGRGTGLGLASVYGIVKGYGGHIICRSTVGRGTRFDIFLPALKQEPVSPEPQEQECAAEGGSETILVVDDEHSVLTAVSKGLERLGYSVRISPCSEEALRIFSSGQPEIDLVLLDLNMPGMGGKKCLEKMLKLNPDAKIVFTSGSESEERIEDYLRKGAAGFVLKPFRLNRLTRYVRRILDGQAP